MEELEKLKAEEEDGIKNAELITQMYEEIDKQNFDFAIDLCTSNVSIYVAGGTEVMKKEGIKPMLTELFTAFPDYTHQIDAVIPKGHYVTVRCTYTGTHKAEFKGIPATGNTFTYAGIYLWHMHGGKIEEGWVLKDMLTLMTQLGMELKPKEAEI